MKFFLLSFAALAAGQSVKLTSLSATTKDVYFGEVFTCPVGGTLTFPKSAATRTEWDDFGVAPFDFCLRIIEIDEEKFQGCEGATMDVVVTIKSKEGSDIANYAKSDIELKPTPLIGAVEPTYLQCLTIEPTELTFLVGSKTLNESRITIEASLNNIAGTLTSPLFKIAAKSSIFVMSGNAVEQVDLPTAEMLPLMLNPYAVIRQNATCDSGENLCTTKFTYNDAALKSVTKTIKVQFDATANKLTLVEAADGYRIDTASAPGPCDPFEGRGTVFDCSIMKVSLLDGAAAQGSAVPKSVLFSLLGALFI